MHFFDIFLKKHSYSHIKVAALLGGNLSLLLYTHNYRTMPFTWETGIINDSAHPPNSVELLPIEYLWLTLLANVTGLWKINTIGKTGRKTPKEFLHDSATLSFQEAQTGNNLKASAKPIDECVSDLCLMFALQGKVHWCGNFYMVNY